MRCRRGLPKWRVVWAPFQGLTADVAQPADLGGDLGLQGLEATENGGLLPVFLCSQPRASMQLTSNFDSKQHCVTWPVGWRPVRAVVGGDLRAVWRPAEPELVGSVKVVCNAGYVRGIELHGG